MAVSTLLPEERELLAFHDARKSSASPLPATTKVRFTYYNSLTKPQYVEHKALELLRMYQQDRSMLPLDPALLTEMTIYNRAGADNACFSITLHSVRFDTLMAVLMNLSACAGIDAAEESAVSETTEEPVHSPTRFLVQKENGLLSPDAAQFIDSICQRNWLERDHDYYYETCSLQQLHNMDLTVHDIPYGSIDFVQHTLSLVTGRKDVRIHPINVPPALCDPMFSGRMIWRGTKADFMAHFPKEDKTNMDFDSEFFVKSDEELKGFQCNGSVPYLVGQMRDLPNTAALFVSSTFPSEIWSEWRIFVYRSQIVDARPYFYKDFDHLVAPFPKMTVLDMISAWNTSPAAYTLDVAVLANNSTCIVEAHNFVSCGLYGFDSPKIPVMAKAAYRQELSALL